MKHAFTILGMLLVAGCTSPVEPSHLASGYFLAMVDDQGLPIPQGTDGTMLEAASLAFGSSERPRSAGPLSGMVDYTLFVRRPDQSLQHSTMQLAYDISDGVLHIDLCPPLALCITTIELVGPVVSRTSELVLTYYVGGAPGSVYRFLPALLE